MSYEQYQDRYNPNDYVERKKEAMRHARELREEREYYGGVRDRDGDYSEHSFQPKINKRPAYLDKANASSYRDIERERARKRDREFIRQQTQPHRQRSTYYEERDRDYSQHVPQLSQYSSDRHSDMQRIRKQMASDDVMERPLPAVLKNLKIDGTSAPKAHEEQHSYSIGTYTKPRYKDRFDSSSTHQAPKIQRSKLGLKIHEPQPAYQHIRHQFENFDINAADVTSNYMSMLRDSPDKKSFIGGEWNDSSVMERVDVFNSGRDGRDKRDSNKSVRSRYDRDAYTPPNWSEREAHIRAVSHRGKGMAEPMNDEIDDDVDNNYYHHYQQQQQQYRGERVIGKGGMKGNVNGARDRLKLLKKKIKPSVKPQPPPVLSPVRRSYGSTKYSPPQAKSPLQERQLKRKEMRQHIRSIKPITPEDDDDLGYRPLYQAEAIILSSPNRKSAESSPAKNLMSAMDAYESPKEKKEMEDKAKKAREDELSVARKETKKVKIIRRESHGDVESEEEEGGNEDVDEDEGEDANNNNEEEEDNDEDYYTDPLDDFDKEDEEGEEEEEEEDDDDDEDIMKKNKMLQNKIKKRHQKSPRGRDTTGNETDKGPQYSPVHKLHDYSEPLSEEIDYAPLYVAGPILSKRQLEQLKKDKLLEKEQQQSAWRHNHDNSSDSKSDAYGDHYSNNAHDHRNSSSSGGGVSSARGYEDRNKQDKNGQDLPDMIGRDALPRTPAAGSKRLEADEAEEFDVKRLYMEPFSPLPEPHVVGRGKDKDELVDEGPRKPEGPHHSPREVQYHPGDDPAEAPPKVPRPTLECPHCRRTFNEAPFQRHVQICQDVFGRKKTAYDASDNHRLQDGTGEHLKRAKRVMHGSGNTNSSPTKDRWKKDSHELRAAMREGRKIQRAIEKGGPLPEYVPSEKANDSYVQCPHCERRFNEHAGARHIPQCKNIIAKPNRLNRGAGVGGGIAGAPVSKSALGGMR